MTTPYNMTNNELRNHLATLNDQELEAALEVIQIEDDRARAWARTPDALRITAHWYAKELGWPVFPLRPGDKLPLIPSAHPQDSPERYDCKGKCGRDGHGLHDATTDPERIEVWWRRTPQANIGLRTGVHFDVLDIDVRRENDSIVKNGFDSLATWRDELPEVGQRLEQALAVCYTANDGRHYFWPPTGNPNAADLRPGIDYRGAGGYVVAPPSRLDNDRMYSWIKPPNARP